MRRLLVATLLLVAACGGRFGGDKIVAELRDGAPFCGQGVSGPTITRRTQTIPLLNGTGTREQPVVECDWTCADTGLFPEPRFSYVTFHTDEAGQWILNRYVDPDPAKASCPK